MNRVGMTIALLAALAVGWLVASMTVTSGPGDAAVTDAEVLRLRDEVTRLRMALGERGPVLHETGGLKGRPTDPAGGSGTTGPDPSPPSPPSPLDTFDIRTFDDGDKAFRALMDYVATMLGRGPGGHLALLDTINATFFEKPGETLTRQLIGSEERAARYLYPLIRFAMNHDAEVADLTETVFRTMAEDPRRLADMAADTIQLFTEGIAYMLPGMVGPKRLDVFARYGRAILEQPEAQQPRAVQRARQDIQRAMASWAPPVSADEAFLRLQQGDLPAEEALAMLARLDPKDVSRLDLDALVGPMMERDPFRVLSILTRLRIDEATRGKLDARLIRGVAEGKVPQTVVAWWLRSSGRQRWEQCRGFIERGLQQSPPEAAGVFLLAALEMRPPPDDDWVDWAERTYQFSDRVRMELKRRREAGR